VKGSPFGKFFPRLFLILLGAASLSGIDVSPNHAKIEPFLLATDQPAIAAAQRKMSEALGRPDLSVPVFIHMRNDDPELPAKLGNLGGTGRPVHSLLYTGQIPRDAARYISNWAQVAYIESAKLAKPLLNLSAPAVFADDVHAGTGLPSPFTGAGMYVGVVDTGLHVAHLDFHTGGAGSPHRVVHWYPDNVTASVDFEGHGTHVTGIAAGNGFSSGGIYTGMAPDASILFGRTTFTTTDIVTSVANLVTFASNNSKPIPVNLSLGSVLGPHDGTSGFESGLNSIAASTSGVARIITVAAGNEADAGEHFQANLASFGTTSIPISFETGISSAVVNIWADGSDTFTVLATMGSEVATVVSGSSGSSPGGRISVSNKVSNFPNGATFISITFVPQGATGATIRLDRTRNEGTGKVDAYIEETDGTFGGATDSGTITEPANAPAVLAVGSFNTKSFTGGAPVTENISSFSSRGPTRDGRLKPDITAPGSVIYSARSFDQVPAFDPIVPGNDNYFIMAGTSMAAPHVAGIAALAWQSNPVLTSVQMRERIRRTANPPTDGSATPNTTWGYGKVNARAAVRNSVASITAPATAIPGSPVNMTSENSSGAIGSPITSYSWSLIQQPAGSGLTLSSATPSASFTPVVPGDYTVGLTVFQTTPAGTPPGSATAVVHVNNVPNLPSISGPASADNLAPVNFQGSGTDPDGQQLSFRWVLVSRPAGSAATVTTADVTNVTLSPDVPGTYEIGLKVDDGLDNSALAIHVYSGSGTAPPLSGGGGGGGGCSVARGKDPADPHESMAVILFLLLPAGILAARRRLILMKLRFSSRVPPQGRPGAP
jgi:subtilisin family serine protease